MRKVLPMKQNITYAWPEHNFLLSIISEKDTAYDWIMNMYVQIYSAHFENGEVIDDRISFYPNGSFTVKSNVYDLCPFIEKYVLAPEMIKEKWQSYEEYLVDRINHNYYCACMVDRFFMNTPGFFHPIYVVGYDLAKKTFICYDNFENGKYKMKEIDCKVFEEAYQLMLSNYKEPYWNSSFLYQVKDYHYEFNSQLLKKLLLDYIEPRKNICYLNEFLNIPCTRYKNSIQLGIESYDLLIRNIQRAFDREQMLDWRSFSFFCDHKHIMNLRYKYLVEYQYVLLKDELAVSLEELEKEWIILQNKCIKYKLTNNKNILKELESRVLYLKALDKKLMQELIGLL